MKPRSQFLVETRFCEFEVREENPWQGLQLNHWRAPLEGNISIFSHFFLLFFMETSSSFGSLQDGCLTRRPQHPTSLCHPLVGTAMPAAEKFWFRQDRIFLLPRSGFLWRLWEWPVRTTFPQTAGNFSYAIANRPTEWYPHKSILLFYVKLWTVWKTSYMYFVTQRVVGLWQKTPAEELTIRPNIAAIWEKKGRRFKMFLEMYAVPTFPGFSLVQMEWLKPIHPLYDAKQG